MGSSPTKLFDDPQKEETPASILKNTFVEGCQNTTVHAIPNIFRSDHIILKVIWFFLLLAAIGAGVYYLYDSIYLYFSYSVNVKVKWYEDRLEDFPAVTFCNINPFDSSVSSTKTYLDSLLSSNGLSSTITPTDSSPAIYQVRQAMKVLKASALSKSNSDSSYVYNLGWSFDSMIISCYFNGNKCNSSSFDRFYSFEYGNCYTFNKKTTTSTSLRTTSKTGPTNGLSLEIFTGYPGRQDYYIEHRGVYVAIHNNSQNPLTRFDGVKAANGYMTDIAIDRTFLYRKEAPYSSCRKSVDSYTSTDNDYVKATIKLTRYTKKLCYEICLQNLFIITSCSCSDPSIPVINSTQAVCATLSQLTCADNVRDKFDSTDLSNSCGSYCPDECDKILYNTHISMTDYPTQYYYDVVAQQSNVINKFSSFGGVTYDTYKKTSLMINVFYKELGYTGIVEEAEYTGSEIFALIGGELGLLMGVSLLSICECFIFFITLIIRLVNYKMNKKNNAVPMKPTL